MSGVVVRPVSWADPSAVALRDAMDAELRRRCVDRLARARPAGEARLESLEVEAEHIAWVGVAYAEDGMAIGHGALRRVEDALELKRMYIRPEYRGTGAARMLLTALEDAAGSLGATRIILQTGDRQPEAVRLYERAGYARIPVFPPYEWMSFAICMEKAIPN
ncbi:GNAT family N-acetyltransferase [Thermomonospora umbrina]|uniref:Acetyltransferase (GNAT) family protein n=1 Tax=Thermomonospora umbrina TaxID=111806 RepID=A0A3D9STK7_9ACTN|nr:GNAT family N-acetyltransferase [Thermomonospora umbrina]REE95041.1 acetyltransferase (GNAT) family protein [Thermomonospora umbrina]